MTREDAEELRRLADKARLKFAAMQLLAHCDVVHGIRDKVNGYAVAEYAFNAELDSLIDGEKP